MTDYLFARPSFFEGMARAIDIGGTLSAFNDSPTPEMADAAAMRSDWLAVGNDIRNALEKFAARYGKNKE